jgi:hypothetical protein
MLPRSDLAAEPASDGVAARARHGGAVIGWDWEAAAEGSAGCGISDDEDRARQAAEVWLKANPQGTAVLRAARLTDGTTTLSAFWARAGLARR